MKLHITSIVILLCGLCMLCSCSEPLRFAPSEPQKQIAELTHALAARINAEGTAPATPASQKLCEGTRAAAVYMGRPKTPPDPAQFDTVAARANTDALQRPDPWSVADNLLELGIGISALIGGAYGLKGVQFLRQAREKSQALQEIVRNNELFKQQQSSRKADFDHIQQAQSAETKVLISKIKASIDS